MMCHFVSTWLPTLTSEADQMQTQYHIITYNGFPNPKWQQPTRIKFIGFENYKTKITILKL